MAKRIYKILQYFLIDLNYKRNECVWLQEIFFVIHLKILRGISKRNHGNPCQQMITKNDST